MKKLSLLLVFTLVGILRANTRQIPFQGYYEEAGVPISGSRDITFEIAKYSWSELPTAVSLDKGLYTITLSSLSSLPHAAFFESNSADKLIIL